MIGEITHITLDVEDQEDALNFYTEKLGFERINDESMGSESRWVSIAPDLESDIEIVLQPPEWFEGDERNRRAAMIGNNPPLGITVDDCQAIYEEWRDQGVEFTSEPELHDEVIHAVARDLYGNPLDLFEYVSGE